MKYPPAVGLLAVALVFQAAPARAEILNLVCGSEQGGSIEYLIDLDRKTVQYPPPRSCTWNIQGRQLVVPDCEPPARAQITERSISWEGVEKIVSGTGVVSNREVRGSMNRTTGAVWVQHGAHVVFEGKCRRATKKF